MRNGETDLFQPWVRRYRWLRTMGKTAPLHGNRGQRDVKHGKAEALSRSFSFAVESLEQRTLLDGAVDQHSAEIPGFISDAVSRFEESPYVTGMNRIWRPTITGSALDSSADDWFLLSSNSVYDDQSWLARQNNIIGTSTEFAEPMGFWSDTDIKVVSSVWVYRRINVHWSRSAPANNSDTYSETIAVSILGFACPDESIVNGVDQSNWTAGLDQSIDEFVEDQDVAASGSLPTSNYVVVKLSHRLTYTARDATEIGEWGNQLPEVSVDSDFSAFIAYQWQDSSITIDNDNLATPEITTTRTEFLEIAGRGNAQGKQNYSGTLITRSIDDEVAVDWVGPRETSDWRKSGNGSGAWQDSDQSSIREVTVKGDLSTSGSAEDIQMKADSRLNRNYTYAYSGSGTWVADPTANPNLDRQGTLNENRDRAFIFESTPTITAEMIDRSILAEAQAVPVTDEPMDDPSTNTESPIGKVAHSRFRCAATPASHVTGLASRARQTNFLTANLYEVRISGWKNWRESEGDPSNPSRVEIHNDDSLFSRGRVGAEYWSSAFHSTTTSHAAAMGSSSYDLHLRFDGGSSTSLHGSMGTTVSLLRDESKMEVESDHRYAAAGVVGVRNGAENLLPDSAVDYMKSFVDTMGGAAPSFDPNVTPLFAGLSIQYNFGNSTSSTKAPLNRFGFRRSVVEFLEEGQTRITQTGVSESRSMPSGTGQTNRHSLETIWNIQSLDGERHFTSYASTSHWNGDEVVTQPKHFVFTTPASSLDSSQGIPSEVPTIDPQSDEYPPDDSATSSSSGNSTLDDEIGELRGYSSTRFVGTSFDSITEHHVGESAVRYRHSNNGIVDDTSGQMTIRLTESTNASENTVLNNRTEFEPGVITNRQHGQASTSWSVSSSDGFREMQWVRDVGGELVSDVEIPLTPTRDRLHYEVFDRAGISSAGAGTDTTQFDVTSVARDLATTPASESNTTQDPEHGPWIPLPALPGYEFTLEQTRYLYFGQSNTKSVSDYELNETQPEFRLVLDEKKTINGAPRNAHFEKVSDTGHGGTSHSTRIDMEHAYDALPAGVESTTNGSITRTDSQMHRFTLPNQVLRYEGLEQNSQGVNSIEVINDAGRESFDSTIQETILLTGFGTRGVLLAVTAQAAEPADPGETSSVTSALPGNAQARWLFQSIGTHESQTRNVGNALESRDVREDWKSTLPTMKASATNTERLRANASWDVTLGVVTHFIGNDTGQKTVSLRGDEKVNQFSLQIDTVGQRDRQYFPTSSFDSLWAVEEWRSGSHQSQLVTNSKYSVGGGIVAGFNTDGWTDVSGSLAYNETSTGTLTNHTDAEGKKEFKRAVSFAPPDNVVSARGSAPANNSSAMVGSGYEVYGYKSIRTLDTIDQYSGQGTGTLIVTLNSEGQLVPHQEYSLSNSVSGTRTGQDQFWTRHSYQLTHNGTSTTYGGGYGLHSQISIAESYGPVDHQEMGFSPLKFGQIGYRGVLGEYTMSAPAATTYIANHVTVDGFAGELLQESGNAQDGELPPPLPPLDHPAFDDVMRRELMIAPPIEREFDLPWHKFELPPQIFRSWNELENLRKLRELENEQASLVRELNSLEVSIAKVCRHIDFSYMAAAAYFEERATPLYLRQLLDESDWTDVARGNSRSGLYWILFRHRETDEFVLAFRGTEGLFPFNADWIANGSNGLVNLIPLFVHHVATQYDEAQGVVFNIKQKYPNAKLTLVGHSLGGGLANFAALIHDIEALVFNPPGTNSVALGVYGASTSKANELIAVYQTRGEALRHVERIADVARWLTPLDAPNIVGRVEVLPGYPLLPITSHGMDVVTSGLSEKLSPLLGRRTDIEMRLGQLREWIRLRQFSHRMAIDE